MSFFNIRQYLGPILLLTAKGDMIKEEVFTCQQCVYKLADFEIRHDLNSQTMKGKEDDYFKTMWNELEAIIESSGKSAGHRAILHYIRTVRNAKASETSEKSEVNSARLRKIPDVNESSSSTSDIKSIVDSPSSPPPHERKGTKQQATLSLYEIMLAKEQAVTNKRLEFSGRLATPLGQVAILYPNFVAKEDKGEYKT